MNNEEYDSFILDELKKEYFVTQAKIQGLQSVIQEKALLSARKKLADNLGVCLHDVKKGLKFTVEWDSGEEHYSLDKIFVSYYYLFEPIIYVSILNKKGIPLKSTYSLKNTTGYISCDSKFIKPYIKQSVPKKIKVNLSTKVSEWIKHQNFKTNLNLMFVLDHILSVEKDMTMCQLCEFNSFHFGQMGATINSTIQLGNALNADGMEMNSQTVYSPFAEDIVKKVMYKRGL